jgi:hypothetical protein
MFGKGARKKGMAPFVLKPVLRKGYPSIHITDKSTGLKRHFSIHRLVAKAFLVMPEDITDLQVAHLDGNRTNNNSSNLLWCSVQTNSDHRTMHGRNIAPKGEKHRCAKLKDDDVTRIRFLYGAGVKICELAKIYDLTHGTISPLVNGKTWKDVK